MTRERVEQATARLIKALTSMWHDEVPNDYPSCGGMHDQCDDPYPLQDIELLSNALAESEKERDEERAAGRQANENSINLLEANQQLLRQLRESEKERDEMAEALAGWGALASRFGTPTEIHRKLSESEKERERLLDALERLGIYVNKYPSIPDLAAQVSKQLRQALSPDSQEKRAE